MTATYLDAILDAHRAAAVADARTVDQLMVAALDMAPTRGFRDALAGADRLGVISEIKRRSPSKGDLDADLDPAEIARIYERGGATCLSVLTDTPHFGGSVSDLQMALARVLAAGTAQGLHRQSR